MEGNNSNDPGVNQNNPYGDGVNQGGQYNDSNRGYYEDRPEPFGNPGGYGYTPMPPAPEMSVKDWLITLLILTIPCVNIIMLFVWAFSSDGNRTRSNYCKANLLLMAILAVVGVVLSGVIGSMLAFAIGDFGRFYY